MKSRPSAFRALILFVFAASAWTGAIVNAHAARSIIIYTNRADASFPEGENGYAWTFNAKGAVSSPCLSFDGLTLYVGSADGRLYAIDTLTGESKWTNGLKLPAPIYSAPIVDENGRIYVGGSDGRLYGISDQGEFGTNDLRSPSIGRPLTTPALADDGTIYVGSTGNRLDAFFPDFARKWVYVAPDDVRTPVVMDDGTILIVSGGFLRGVSDDGTEASSFIARSAIKSLPAVAEDGSIYLGSRDNFVYALDAGATTNDVRWRFNTSSDVMSSPAIGADGSIYIASDNSRVYSFTTNGAVRWSVTTKAPVRSALSIGVDGTIYAGCDDKRLYAISSDGPILWTAKTRAPVRSSPVLDAFGVVYFCSGKTVYAIETEAMADDSDEPAWPMFRNNAQHTARATECRPFLISEPQRLTNDVKTGRAVLTGEDVYNATNHESVSISFVVRAGAPVSYQWRLNGAEIDDEENRTATNTTFVITSVSAADAGEYSVHAFNDCGEVESSQIFTLNIVNAAPLITADITNQLLLASSTLALQVGVAGTPPLSYQWYFNSNRIDFETNATFSITNAQPANSGVYYVTVTNQNGRVDSFHASVSVFSNTLTLADHPLGAGQRHSLAVLPDQTLWAWGLNNFGQLGDGNSGVTGTNFVFRNGPQLIGTNGTVTTNAVWSSVSGGSRGYDVAANQPGGFSIGLQTNGTLWAWGLNDRGQLGIDSFTLQRFPVQVGTETNWVQAEAGATHVIALKRDGTIWTWGANESGQLGLGSTTSNSPTPVRVGRDSAWVEVRAGGFFSLARRADGTIWGWGTNFHGQLGLGASGAATNRVRSPVMIGTNSDWAAISAGVFHSLGLKTNGTLWSWGRNNFGQLGLGLGTGNGNDTSNTNRPARVGSSSDWVGIEAGNFHSFAISSTGGLFAWGGNFFGQLGNGAMGSTTATNDQNKVSPVAVAAEKIWRTVDASSHSLGMTVDGNVWGWGWNGNGQVGDRTGGDGSRNFNRSLPVPLNFIADTNLVATNPPVIILQPATQGVDESATVSFSVSAGGTPVLTYQWFFNSNAIASAINATATNATLTITNAMNTNDGFYHVVVTNNFGRATSTVARLTVGITNGPPVIVQGPTAHGVLTNTTTTFSVTVAGASPFFYQWRFNSNPIDPLLNSTATNSTLTLSNLTSLDQGFYDVVITNIFGMTNSVPALLGVTNSSTGPGPGFPFSDAPLATELRIESITVSSNGVSIAVAGSANHTVFVLEYTDALDDPNWKPIGTNSAGALKLLDPSPPLDRARYYRIRAE